MIEHHAFGVTRRSRREEHISEVVGGLDRFQRTCVEAREIKLVDRQSLHGYRPLQPGIQMRLREGHPNFTTLKQKLQALEMCIRDRHNSTPVEVETRARTQTRFPASQNSSSRAIPVGT